MLLIYDWNCSSIVLVIDLAEYFYLQNFELTHQEVKQNFAGEETEEIEWWMFGHAYLGYEPPVGCQFADYLPFHLFRSFPLFRLVHHAHVQTLSLYWSYLVLSESQIGNQFGKSLLWLDRSYHDVLDLGKNNIYN